MREDQARDIKAAIEKGHPSLLVVALENATPVMLDYAVLKFRETHRWKVSTDDLQPVEVLDVLIAAKAPIESTYSKLTGTLLAEMCCSGKTPLVRRLVDAGAMIDGRWGDNATRPILRQPLAMAAYHGHGHLVGMLLDAGATVDLPDEAGQTALWWAASQGQLQIMERLRAAGANPLHLDVEGSNLAVAFLSKTATMDPEDFEQGVYWLLEQGVDLDQDSEVGSSFLESLDDTIHHEMALRVRAQWNARKLQQDTAGTSAPRATPRL